MKATFFKFLPVLLLLLSVGGWGVMISMATSDPSFGVEPAYYQKAARFDEELARRRASLELGWRVDMLEFTRSLEGGLALDVRLADREGTALGGATVSVEALSNLRGGVLHTAVGRARDDGRVALRLPAGPSGLWELRFTAVRGNDTFSQVVRADLASIGGGT